LLKKQLRRFFCANKFTPVKKENIYFRRSIDAVLLDWRKEPDRKPLLLRGARQVRKSSVVRHLSGEFDHFIEINFGETKDIHTPFQSNLSPL